MIDREARNKLAEEIRRFLSCLTDNIQFDDAIFEIKTNDKAVTEIRDQMWHTYDDVLHHKLKGRKALSEKDRNLVKRFILYLKTDLECETVNKNADSEIWPFSNNEEYEAALKEPRYLNVAT